MEDPEAEAEADEPAIAMVGLQERPAIVVSRERWGGSKLRKVLLILVKNFKMIFLIAIL